MASDSQGPPSEDLFMLAVRMHYLLGLVVGWRKLSMLVMLRNLLQLSGCLLADGTVNRIFYKGITGIRQEDLGKKALIPLPPFYICT